MREALKKTMIEQELTAEQTGLQNLDSRKSFILQKDNELKNHWFTADGIGPGPYRPWLQDTMCACTAGHHHVSNNQQGRRLIKAVKKQSSPLKGGERIGRQQPVSCRLACAAQHACGHQLLHHAAAWMEKTPYGMKKMPDAYYPPASVQGRMMAFGAVVDMKSRPSRREGKLLASLRISRFKLLSYQM